MGRRCLDVERQKLTSLLIVSRKQSAFHKVEQTVQAKFASFYGSTDRRVTLQDAKLFKDMIARAVIDGFAHAHAPHQVAFSSQERIALICQLVVTSHETERVPADDDVADLKTLDRIVDGREFTESRGVVPRYLTAGRSHNEGGAHRTYAIQWTVESMVRASDPEALALTVIPQGACLLSQRLEV